MASITIDNTMSFLHTQITVITADIVKTNGIMCFNGAAVPLADGVYMMHTANMRLHTFVQRVGGSVSSLVAYEYPRALFVPSDITLCLDGDLMAMACDIVKQLHALSNVYMGYCVEFALGVGHSFWHKLFGVRLCHPWLNARFRCNVNGHGVSYHSSVGVFFTENEKHGAVLHAPFKPDGSVLQLFRKEFEKLISPRRMIVAFIDRDLNEMFYTDPLQIQTAPSWTQMGSYNYDGIDVYKFVGPYQNCALQVALIKETLHGENCYNGIFFSVTDIRLCIGDYNETLDATVSNHAGQLFAFVKREHVYCPEHWMYSHRIITDIAIAMMPLELPDYVVLAIVDFLDGILLWPEIMKVELIKGLKASSRKVWQQRSLVVPPLRVARQPEDYGLVLLPFDTLEPLRFKSKGTMVTMKPSRDDKPTKRAKRTK